MVHRATETKSVKNFQGHLLISGTKMKNFKTIHQYRNNKKLTDSGFMAEN